MSFRDVRCPCTKRSIPCPIQQPTHSSSLPSGTRHPASLTLSPHRCHRCWFSRTLVPGRPSARLRLDWTDSELSQLSSSKRPQLATDHSPLSPRHFDGHLSRASTPFEQNPLRVLSTPRQKTAHSPQISMLSSPFQKTFYKRRLRKAAARSLAHRNQSFARRFQR